MECIKCNKRLKASSNEARKERRNGMIPGIIYGRHIKNAMFEVADLDFNREISKNGEHCTLNVDLEGVNYKTYVKEIQRDSVTRKVIHIDLEEFEGNREIITDIPIVFTGEQHIIKDRGILQKEKSSIRVQGKMSCLPQNIIVDVSNLKLRDSLKVSDIEVSSEIAVLDDKDAPIVYITDGNTHQASIEVENQ